MRLILHIGFHKTGTSAIQAFSVKNREKLAQKGILYPKAGASKPRFPSRSTSESGHRVLSDVLVSPTNLKSAQKLEAIIAEAGSYEEINTVILSSETFSAPRVIVSPAVADVLKKYFSGITVLAYLRRQDVWAETFYKEILCWNGRKEKRDFKRFNDGFLGEWLDYSARLEVWERIFGKENITIKSYDDRENKNIIIDFFKAVGFDGIEQFEFPGVINPSLPNDLVPLLLEANKLNLDREQKSFITNLVFDELSKSDYKVKKKKIIPDELLQQYKDECGPGNIQLCERFGVTRNDVLCFVTNEFQAKQDRPEVSLTEAAVEEIRKKIHQLNAETLAKTNFNHDRPDRGRVGVSCLLNESPLQTETFVKYHLALGVSRIRLYMDDPDDPMVNFNYGTDCVEIIKCTAEFWQDTIGREPFNNGEKLSVCHQDGLNYLNTRDDIDWVINLDADELLFVARGVALQEYLRRLPKTVDQLVVMPLEAIFVSDDDARLFSARYFKVPRLGLPNELPVGRRLKDKILRRLILKLEEFGTHRIARKMLLTLSGNVCTSLPWIKSDEALYQNYMPVLSQVMRDGFLAHREGRTFTRHGIKLDDITSHIPRYSGRKLRVRRKNNTVFVLHYDAVDYSAWHMKWHRRIYGHTTASAIHEKRKLQQEMFRLACEKGNQQLKELFGALYTFPEASIPEFLRAGLVIKLDQPLLARIKGEAQTINGRQGNKGLHFLHISKTGGTAIKYAIAQRPVDSPYTIYLHRHRFLLEDVPVGEKVVFFLRDPVSRFVSAFHSRQRQGQPRYSRPWTRKEKKVFEEFGTPNELALALSSTDVHTKKRAQLGMQRIRHVRDSYWRWFKDEEYFKSRISDIVFIGFQERLAEDFELLKSIIGLPENAELPADDVQAHRSPRQLDEPLDDEAVANLKQWYKDDFQFVALCKQFIEHQSPGSPG